MQRAPRFGLDADRDMVPFLLAACAAIFPLGSSGELWLRNAAGPARWVLLAALALWELVVLARAPRRWWSELRFSRYHLVWVAFLVLAFASATWSVTPLSSAKHAVSMVLLAVAVLAAVWRYGGRIDGAERCAAAIAIGMGAVLAVSFVLGVVDPGSARQINILNYHPQWRWQGVFESPNELALEALIFFPLVFVPALRSSGRRRWLLFAASGLALSLAILSGTRSSTGWIVLVALVLTAARPPQPRAALAAAGALLAVGIATAAYTSWSVPQHVVIALPPPTSPTVTTTPSTTGPSTRTGPSKTTPGTSTVPATTTTTTQSPAPTTTGASWFRSVTVKSLSGRTEAWSRAVFEIRRRPVGGWGFSTERDVIEVFRLRPDPSLSRAVLDKVRTSGQPGLFKAFAGGYVENSYLGCTLQLGLLGAFVLLLQLLGPAIGAVRQLAGSRGAVSALAGVVLAGLLAAVVESFLWNAGSTATVPFWAAAALVLRAADRPPSIAV